METKDVLYFEKPGPQNTEAVLRAAVTRARQLDVTHVVVASTRGETALQCQKAFEGTGVQIVSVGPRQRKGE